MKIMFFCGSLEPGHDGVGDYTRRLAGALACQGNEVQIVALYDKNVKTITLETQKDDITEIKCLRLPEAISWDNKYKTVGDFLEDLDPEWLSLQYVPFAFHDKGLPFGLDRKLKKLAKGRRWHIMFHELWLGLDKEASFKMKLWGQVQRLLIVKMLKELKPTHIHTQMTLYKEVLKEVGYRANLLPLFSNIPFNFSSDNAKDSENFTCILFGSIHIGAPVKAFVEELKKICNEKKRLLRFIFVGRCGAAKKEWITVLECLGIPYDVKGECNTQEISNCLQVADLGITTTPYYLVEKSGTFAAMLSHFLPVICVARSWTPVICMNKVKIDSVAYYQPGNLKELLSFTISQNSGYITPVNAGKLLVDNLING